MAIHKMTSQFLRFIDSLIKFGSILVLLLLLPVWRYCRPIQRAVGLPPERILAIGGTSPPEAGRRGCSRRWKADRLILFLIHIPLWKRKQNYQSKAARGERLT